MSLHTFTNGSHARVTIPSFDQLEQLIEDARAIEAVVRRGYHVDRPAPVFPIKINDIALKADVIPLNLIDREIAVLDVEITQASRVGAETPNSEAVFYFFAIARSQNGAWHLPERAAIVQLVSNDEHGVEEFLRLRPSEQLRLLGY